MPSEPPESNELGADGGFGHRRPRSARPALSLRARALKYLAQREHSRFELEKKLATHAVDADQLRALLDEFERLRYLSAPRFVESVVQRKAARFGMRAIAHELGQHQLAAGLTAPALARLKETEPQRALEVWRRKFSEPPRTLEERARQHRFLAQRGFGSEAITWVLRHGCEAPEG